MWYLQKCLGDFHCRMMYPKLFHFLHSLTLLLMYLSKIFYVDGEVVWLKKQKNWLCIWHIIVFENSDSMVWLWIMIFFVLFCLCFQIWIGTILFKFYKTSCTKYIASLARFNLVDFQSLGLAEWKKNF